MTWSVDFAPFFSWTVIGLIAVPAAILAAGLVLARLRGAFIRVMALAALVLALLNPVVLREERDPLKSVVALVVDRSQSQTIGEREAETTAAVEALQTSLSRFPEFEVRTVEARSGASPDSDATTALFSAMSSALSDVPPARVGGAIMVTDGEVHDIPADASRLGFEAPVHGLITGREDEYDRRIEIVSAPRFGLVDEPQRIAYRVIEDGPASGTGGFNVQVFLNGDLVTRQNAQPDAEQTVDLVLPRAGKNIVELQVERADNEITDVNNRSIAIVDGIRENLRVLLVSG